MKNVLKFLLLLALAAYLVVAVVVLSPRSGGARAYCAATDIVVADSDVAGFITRQEIRSILSAAGQYPTGKRMGSVDCGKIESILVKNPFIDNATSYKTAGDRVVVTVTQRLPVMRVISDGGDNYYIDTRGKIMPHMHYSADLAVATGHISRKFAHSTLVPIGRMLKYDKFWDSQIEQIYVDSAGCLEMYPRVGNHVVYLGKPERIPQKLKRLKAFYSQVLNQAGWNKYSRIDLEYENQIICRK